MIIEESTEVTALPRTQQRAFVLHALYSVDSLNEGYGEDQLNYVLRGYLYNFGYHVQLNDSIYNEIMMVLSHYNEIDQEIITMLKKWDLQRLSVMVRLILRYAMAELLYTAQDSALIINEAIELAKNFAENDSYRLINGMLDSWTKKNNK